MEPSSQKASLHTPGPWHWGEGWTEYDSAPWGNNEYDGPKYADIQLRSSKRVVLPLRIDHHTIEWDSTNGLGDFTAADRRLIAAAPELLEACKTADAICRKFGDRLTYEDDWQEFKAMWDALGAAIAKAGG